MIEKAELIITALQQRIGEIVSNYETQIAMLRAELTTVINQSEKEKALDEYSEEILQKISEATDGE
jgi:UDP-N-acetylglucosamine transferase subunit ALG13